MGITIRLDNQRMYGPGSTVSGRLILAVTTQLEEIIDKATVTFSGTSWSKVEGGQFPSRARVSLFTFTQCLHEVPLTRIAPGEKVEWPFSFTFPRVAPAPRFLDGSDSEWLPNDKWPYATTDALLPPSFVFDDIDLSRTSESVISYTIEGRVNRHASLDPPSFVTKRFLAFSPTRSEHLPTVRHRSITCPLSFLALPEPRNSWHGFKQKLQSEFHNSRAPKCRFNVTVSLPDTAIGNTKMVVLVKTQLDPPDGPASGVIPPISLVGASMSVDARTSVRTRGGHMRVREDLSTTEITVAVRDSINIPLVPDGTIRDIGDILDFRLGMVPINFISYHIKRSYTSLNLLVTVQCAKKKRQFLSSNTRFRVLSPLYFGGDSNELAPRLLSSYTSGDPLQEDLPAYVPPGEVDAAQDEESEVRPPPSYKP